MKFLGLAGNPLGIKTIEKFASIADKLNLESLVLSGIELDCSTPALNKLKLALGEKLQTDCN